jgi:hypothetical protein
VIVDSAVGDSLAITDGFGNYEIRGLDPGLYHVRVRKEGLMPGPEYNHRWSGEVDNEQGIVTVGANSCEILDLAMWANSRISGSVYDNRGGPVDGVAVQAFSVFGRRGQSIDST